MLELNLEEIDSEIVRVLEALETNFQSNGRVWQCPSNPADMEVEGSGKIIAAEALLCYLLPLSAAGKNSDFSKRILSVVSRSALQKRVDEHLLGLKTRQDFTGNPYLNIVDHEGNSHPFIDSYCFTVSILLLYADVFGEPRSAQKKKHFKELFLRCLRFIKNCAIKQDEKFTGFFVTDEMLSESPFKYPTWMVIDTLADLDGYADIETFVFSTKESTDLSNILIGNVFSDIKEEYIRLYVLVDLTEKEEKHFEGRNIDLTKGLVKEDEDDISPHYNLWAMLIFLHLNYTEIEIFEDAFNVLKVYIEDAAKLEKQREVPCKIQFASEMFPVGGKQDNKLSDRCFLPQFVKALSMFLRLFPEVRDDDKNFDYLLATSVSELLSNRNEGSVLWDTFSEGGELYSIYQTERAIEGLMGVRRLLMADQMQSKKPAQSLSSSNLVDANWVEAIVQSAIQINIDGEDGRKLVEREINIALSKAMKEAEQKLDKMVRLQVDAAVGAVIEKLDSENLEKSKSSKVLDIIDEVFVK